MPSVSVFAECQTTGTRQRCGLPSARPRALGKNLAHGMPGRCRVQAVGKSRHSAMCLLCRVLAGQHSAKPEHVPSTRARRAPAVRVADGVYPLPSAARWHSAKIKLCRVPSADTRQRFFRRVPENRHSANMVNFFRPSNFFVLYLNLRI